MAYVEDNSGVTYDVVHKKAHKKFGDGMDLHVERAGWYLEIFKAPDGLARGGQLERVTGLRDDQVQWLILKLQEMVDSKRAEDWRKAEEKGGRFRGGRDG